MYVRKRHELMMCVVCDVCVRACTHVTVCVFMCIRVRVGMCVYVYAHLRLCGARVRARVYKCVSVFMRTCVCVIYVGLLACLYALYSDDCDSS